MTDELLARTHCLLRHLDRMERDGLANSLHHFEQVREDARAIESELLGEAVQQPVHL